MRKTLVLLLFYFILISAVYAQDVTKQYLEWEPHPAAIRYRVLVLKDNIEIFSTETEETSVTLDLEPGRYVYYVILINKFQKEGGKSSGEIFVEQVKSPIVKQIYPRNIYSDAEDAIINLSLYQVYPDTTFQLRKNDKAVVPELLDYDGSQARLRIFPKGLDNGPYDLVITNPGGKETVVSQAVSIVDKQVPVFTSHNLEIGRLGAVYPRIIVNGSGFEEGCKLYFSQKDFLIEPVEIISFSSEQLVIWLDLTDLTEEHIGEYTIHLENPNGQSSETPRALRVDLPREVYWRRHNFGSDLLLGAVCVPILISDGELMDPRGYWGVDLRYDIDFNDSVPFFRFFGLELNVGWIYLDNFDLHSLHTGVGLYFRSRSYGAMDFLLKAEMGGQWIFGAFQEGGPYIAGAAALDFNIFRNIQLQMEAGVHMFFTTGSNVYMFPISISLGYRF